MKVLSIKNKNLNLISWIKTKGLNQLKKKQTAIKQKKKRTMFSFQTSLEKNLEIYQTFPNTLGSLLEIEKCADYLEQVLVELYRLKSTIRRQLEMEPVLHALQSDHCAVVSNCYGWNNVQVVTLPKDQDLLDTTFQSFSPGWQRQLTKNKHKYFSETETYRSYFIIDG